MRLRSFSDKQVLVGSVLLSLAYNLAWFIALLYTLQSIIFQTIAVTLFLIIYLFLAQPLKDFLFSIFYRAFYDHDVKNNIKIEKRIQAINSIEDIYDFLSYLVKQWNLPRLRLVLYEPEERTLFISKSGHGKWIKFRRKEKTELIDYLRVNQIAQNTEAIPSEIKKYLYNHEVKSLSPVIYREILLGFIGFTDQLDDKQLELCQYVAKRIALLMGNELLKINLPKSVLLQKEFNLARRVESFLTRTEPQEKCGYNIQLLSKPWQEKYFPAMFDTNITNYPAGFFDSLLKLNFMKNLNSKPKGEKPLVLILVRVAQSAYRASALQLFSVQGYFISLTQEARGLLDLLKIFQRTLIEQEDASILLDGFLLYCEPDGTWEIAGFGTDLQIKVDEESIELPVTKPLGNDQFSPGRILKFKTPIDITLQIKGFPLVYIAKQAA